jgi:hypothetical protein
MTRRAYIYFVITFVIGLIVGGWGVYYYARSSGTWRHSFNENALIHNWAKRLEMTPSQVKEFRSIIDDHIKAHRALNKEFAPKYEALHRDTGNRIRGILTPQQVKKFDSIIEARRQAEQKK